MGSKLTLNIDDSVVKRAKAYARKRNTSLSKVIQQYLQYVTESEVPASDITERVSRLADTLDVTETDDEIKFDYLRDKYLDA